MLKLSMMTPMNKLRVKNDPKMMKKTKYKYITGLFSSSGCSVGCNHYYDTHCHKI